MGGLSEEDKITVPIVPNGTSSNVFTINVFKILCMFFYLHAALSATILCYSEIMKIRFCLSRETYFCRHVPFYLMVNDTLMINVK